MAYTKLPARYMGIVFPLVVSFFMSCIMSCVVTLRTIGLADDFLFMWATAWGLSWVVAFPILFLVIPMCKKIVSLLVEGTPH